MKEEEDNLYPIQKIFSILYIDRIMQSVFCQPKENKLPR